MPRAAGLAALLEPILGSQVRLIPGQRGEFSLWLDGTRIASKDARGFPAESEVLELVRQAMN